MIKNISSFLFVRDELNKVDSYHKHADKFKYFLYC